MEHPREPRFYPNEAVLSIRTDSNAEKTLQSIDGTLKRIEAILIEWKNQFSVWGGQAFSQQK